MALLTIVAAAASAPQVAAQAGLPKSGAELIERMHAKYDGKWYTTLTFVQKTTLSRPGSPEQVQTWYEGLRAPSTLRIDLGQPSEGNGMLFTADSTYVLRAGKVARVVPEGNPLIPFVSALYTQPVARTIEEVSRGKYDMGALRAGTWEGRPVIVVGARTEADSTSPQFWVDAEKLIVLRMLLPAGQGASAKTEDVRFDKYVPLAGGWLATQIEVLVGGITVQKEEYTDYRADVKLSPDFFDPAKWTTAPHWVGAAARP